jgi:pyoverdine/dityrosine biosynthesis protein Dit1
MISTFETQFETTEERNTRIKEENKRNELSLSFSQFAQNPEDPLYPVWHRLPKDAKSEAREIALDMLQEGHANAVIATELVECFLKN